MAKDFGKMPPNVPVYNKWETDSELAKKQGVISDLDTIRSGAAKGETSVQPSALGTAASKDVPASGNASAAQVVMGNDTRLSDARPPTEHTHSIGDIILPSSVFFEGDLLAVNNKGDVVPFSAPQGILMGSNKGGITTLVVPEGVLVGNKGDIVAGIAGTDYVAPGHKLPSREINQEKCIKCGACMAGCKFKAISKE